MRARIDPGCFSRTVRVPASKSHTIRRLLVAALSDGVSRVEYPLDSLDARSCVAVCRGLGAVIDEERAADSRCPNPAGEDGKRLVRWTVRGISRPPVPSRLPIRLDAGNSGTTLYLCMAAAALGSAPVEFSGDEQLRRRSAAPLLEALAGLGVRAESANGCVPLLIQGPWKGGRVRLPCPTSQYLSALLLAAPLAPEHVVTEIDVPVLNERPYIEMTLSYLDAQGVTWESVPDFSYFRIRGGAAYKPLDGPVPGDFSSAAFPACAAAVSGGTLTILGLEPGDTQGDKAFFEILAHMGREVAWSKDPASGEWRVTVSGRGPLRGGEFDLNAAPDMLPALAVLAAFVEGDTAIVNVAHARIKETDRIAVMAGELGRLGIACAERSDGLVIQGGRPQGGRVDSHGDHRIAMALAALAAGASGPVEIDGAECAAVTYPGFLELLTGEREEGR